MNPHPRIRKTVKWAGAAATVLLAAVWIWSLLDGRGWEVAPNRFLIVARGGVRLDLSQPNPNMTLHFVNMRFGPRFQQDWLPWCRINAYPDWHLALPFWILCGCTSLIAAAAWRLETLSRRRARIGLCPKCHYDRTGLAPGAPCPECGKLQA